MKTITIGWLNKCRCGNKLHTVKTARGNESGLWDDDAVKCNSCGRGGVIQVCEGQARVLWETDEEMAENKPMSTITREFTKEQLQHIIETDHVQCGEASALARIALASLEAEPVAYIFKHPAGRLFWSLTDESNKGQSDVMPVYSAPVPAFVPPAIEPDYEVIKGILPTANPDEYACCIAADMWNACRAAMLQGKAASDRLAGEGNQCTK